MQKWKHSLRNLLVDEGGPTAVEYAVMLALIIIAAIGAVLVTGDVQRLLFQDNADAMYDAMNPGN
jgi:pilus assembly protein Flp/PilA